MNSCEIPIREKKPTVGEMVAEDFRTAPVFKKYDIDFCCGGKKTLEEACNEKGIDINDLKSDLKTATSRGTSTNDFNKWEPEFLVDYIESFHHVYVRETLPHIIALAHKVSYRHGGSHEELFKLEEHLNVLSEELMAHMEKEEQQLFPAARALENKRPGFQVDFNTFIAFENEHQEAGDLVKEIRDLSNNYTPPEGACTSYSIYFKLLEEFETDLHQHVHLENNILFPKLKKYVSQNAA